MSLRDEWLTFLEKLLAAGTWLGNAAKQPARASSFSDPKLLALLLLARTMSHIRGVHIMIQTARVLEARILVRNCFENAFYAARLIEDGDKFLKEFLEDDKKRRSGQGRLLYETGMQVGDDFRQWMKDNKDFANSKTIDVKSTAKAGPIKQAYLFYTWLSQDAHPTTNALSRYLQTPNGVAPIVNFDPPASDEEAIDTLGLCAVGAMGVIVSVNDILGTRMDWSPLAGEYQGLLKKDQS